MLTCAENLRFFGGVQGLGGARLRERVDSVATFARVANVLQRRAGELSGGLRRRLNLAIGLLTEPRILLLDEPTSALDEAARDGVERTLADLARGGVAMVLVTHDRAQAERIASEVIELREGRVVA
jgi:ABC-2 type transport system ATP-binding protein